ncbi:TATA-binding protein-associated factor [Fistulifera solaris]|uniref:TATA-binding protein-associated factor n=1 Tax=Fistulifera solaris TaxID=1519565 RepID=A0A1Z5KS25_FISSO|nr:TATA-binding protein-associated factor [Fistulifera solaris]|eukprot:GAX29120.1 TATA-binding protein-associated factor [Fistulifera solaris]
MKRCSESVESSRKASSSPPSSLSPHTLRLLRLVLEGTVEHAEEASFHLQRCTGSPTQLWEILGRLQEGLTSPTWKTRTQAADALQGVSQQLPVSDQVNFMQSTFQDPTAYHYLRVDDLLSNSTLERILEQGQALYSTSFERYDYDQELRDDDSDETSRKSRMQRRMALQRQIMAERLGLAKITEVIGGNSGLGVSDVKAFYAETKIQAAKKRRKDAKSSNESFSVCDLLVSEINHTLGSNEANNVSHRNPQELLASELVFRMFDSAWHRRHGALLGLISLIRAWRKSYTTETAALGLWLQDVLSRALCVLALDRFGDFAGAMIADTECRTGGVVAPVRELAGQLISLLFQLASSAEKSNTLKVLQKLAEYKDSWEPRHGALTCLKYILVVLQSSETGEAREIDNRVLPETLWHTAVQSLGDESDDVKGSAAQLLLERMRGSHHIPLYFTEAFPIVIKSARDAADVSSSLVDLMELLATFLEGSASNYPECPDVVMENLGELTKILLSRLDSEFGSVRLACLRAVKSLSAVYKTNLSSKSPFITDDDLSVFCQLIQRIFVMLTAPKESTEKDDNVNYIIEAEQSAIWDLLSDICRLIQHRSTLLFKMLENELLLFYYWDSKRKMVKDEAVLPLRLAGALATFVVSTEWEMAILKHGSIIRMFLQSPLIYQFEASSLLYSCLCEKSQAFSQRETNDLLLQFLNGNSPTCLYVCQNPGLQNATFEHSFVSNCRVAFKTFLTTFHETTQGASGERYKALWTEELLRRGYTIPEKYSKMSSLLTMRIETLIAGAIVMACFPAKLTPIIRPLMTSLLNEQQTGDRISILTSAFTVLLEKMDPSMHSTTLTKVISKLCEIAISEDEEGNAIRSDVASDVLSSYVRRLSSVEDLLSSPLWPKIACVSTSSDTTPDQRKGLSLLRIVCERLQPDTPISAYLIATFAPALVEEACVDKDDHDDMRKMASSILRALCKLDGTLLMKRILRLLLPRLSSEAEESRLLLVTITLKDVVEGCGTAVCLFVRVLLPSVMQLMCNTSQACSHLASSIFSILVLNAPFAQSTTTVSFQECGLEPVCENVIDHLIFGLPIPNYELPTFVTDELSNSQIILRDYQKEGISWLRFLQSLRLNGSLCDSMGLGKTLQALIAVALAHYDHDNRKDGAFNEEPKSLIVCPSSVGGHWINEIKKYFPLGNVFSPLLYSGSLATRQALKSEKFTGCNIIVTSYSVLRSEVDTFCEREWMYCVLDEGHLLKNPKTATAMASKKLRAQHRLVLTGTPVQNNVNEVWAMFDFLMPNYLGSAAAFIKTYARPIMKSQLPTASTLDVQEGNSKLKILHQQTLPFILRREKEQVLRELPPKIITVFNVPLSPIQKEVYAEFCSRSEAQESLRWFESMLVSEKMDPAKMGSGVLKTILFLRLLCSHPTLVLPEQHKASEKVVPLLYSIESSGKISALQYLLSEAGILSEQAMGADGDYSALYSDLPEDECEDLSSQMISHNDFVEAENVERFGDTRCLIFAQFTRTLDIVENMLLKLKFPSVKYSRIDGKVPAEKRAALAEGFNTDKSVSIMLLTTRVGSLGLNLTGANMVIMLESDFNPFADLQAIDRAHRIGQNDSVRVFKLITKDSIEESIQLIQNQKLKVSDALVNADNSTMFQMGTDKLLDLFATKPRETAGVDLEHIDLDALLAAYADEYTSLSAIHFSQSL